MTVIDDDLLAVDGSLALIARLGPRPAWYDRARCRGLPAAMFFPNASGARRTSVSDDSDDAQRALEVCGACPVRVDCLRYALEHHPIDGIWGGTSETMRASTRGSKRRRAGGRKSRGNGVTPAATTPASDLAS